MDVTSPVVLLTGASGFLGTHVSEALPSLSSGLVVVPWERSRFGDLRSSAARNAAWAEVRPEIVVHLAWESTAFPDYENSLEHDEWARASADFARECVGRGAWFVVAGSGADVQGDTGFASPYSDAKRRLRSEVESLTGDVTWFSPQFIFSLPDGRPRLLKAFLGSGARSDFVVTHPEQRRDFIHVEDLASAVTTILQHHLTGAVYAGTGMLRSPQDLVNAAYTSLTGATLRDRLTVPETSATQPEALITAGWRPIETEAFFGAP